MRYVNRLQQALTAMLVLSFACSASAQMNHDEHAGPTMNHHVINERLATGGHLVDDGLDELAEDGVTVVIDLRDEPPQGQKDKLAAKGIEWINVPVVWKDPRPEDFEAFSAAMSKHQGDKVLVQCQANYRASAMTYAYRVQVENVSEHDAAKDLNAVWEPNEQWQEYLNSIID